DVGAQSRGDQLREIVGRADQPGLLVGAIEVLVDHREVARKAAPGRLDVVAVARDREGRRQRELAVRELEARPAGMGDPVLALRRREERLADSTLIGELRAEAELPADAQREKI